MNQPRRWSIPARAMTCGAACALVVAAAGPPPALGQETPRAAAATDGHITAGFAPQLFQTGK
jgi:hypothetical protein